MGEDFFFFNLSNISFFFLFSFLILSYIFLHFHLFFFPFLFIFLPITHYFTQVERDVVICNFMCFLLHFYNFKNKTQPQKLLLPTTRQRLKFMSFFYFILFYLNHFLQPPLLCIFLSLINWHFVPFSFFFFSFHFLSNVYFFPFLSQPLVSFKVVGYSLFLCSLWALEKKKKKKVCLDLAIKSM